MSDKYAQYPAIISAFIEWTEAKGKYCGNEEINHSSDYKLEESAWCNCAVGTFFQEHEGFRLEGENQDKAFILIEPLHEHLRVVGDLLNCCLPSTYGELDKIVQYAIDHPDINCVDWGYDALHELLPNSDPEVVDNMLCELGFGE